MSPLIALVVVPYIILDQHIQLAEQTLATVNSKHKLLRIAVANNLRNDRDKAWLQSRFDHALVNEENNLARAWNRGINLALEQGAQYILVSNLDLIYQIGSIDRLVEFAQDNPQAVMWGASEHAELHTLETRALEQTHFEGVAYASFLVNNILFERVGQFDEGFTGAYYEDCDMDYRLRLGKHSRLTTRNAYYYHYDRGTVKSLALAKQEDLVHQIDQMRERNRLRYIAKWGGDSWSEKFVEPFAGI